MTGIWQAKFLHNPSSTSATTKPKTTNGNSKVQTELVKTQVFTTFWTFSFFLLEKIFQKSIVRGNVKKTVKIKNEATIS